MNVDQIHHVLAQGELAAIVTTRNATFFVVGSDGTPASARYELLEWNDALGLVTLRTLNQSNPNQYGTIMHLNYDIIDEMITIDK